MYNKIIRMALFQRMKVIKDLSATIDAYEKIIKQKLEYNLDLLYQLSILDAEMGDSVDPSEDNTDNDTVIEPQDNTQILLENIIVPNPDLNKIDLPDVITPVDGSLKNGLPVEHPDGSVLPAKIDKVVKKAPKAKRGRPKK